MKECVKTVMNTIPIIFNQRQIKRLVIGANKVSDEIQTGSVVQGMKKIPLSVILLNRGGRYYRSSVFQNLSNFAFESIVSVELTTESYDIESLSLRFPHIQFLIPQEEVTIGDMINMGMAEVKSDFVLVIWNDVKITPTTITPRLLEWIISEKKMCIGATLFNNKMQTLPVQMVPSLEKRTMSIHPLPFVRDNVATMYANDFMGIYHREKFIQSGGFDYTIVNPYWQNLDFGFRCFLWGEEISLSTLFRLSYENENPQEDVTPNRSSLRFYLKNLAPLFKNDHAVLPKNKFISYLKRSRNGPFEAWKEFADARSWVETNKFRFVSDAKTIIEMWEAVL